MDLLATTDFSINCDDSPTAGLTVHIALAAFVHSASIATVASKRKTPLQKRNSLSPDWFSFCIVHSHFG
jgi:hypothetical protein